MTTNMKAPSLSLTCITLTFIIRNLPLECFQCMRTLIVDFFFFYVSFPSLYKQCLAQKILNAVHPEECDFIFFVDVPSSIEGGQ